MVSKFDFEEYWPQINCLIPITDENGGNSTQIYMQNGGKVLIQNRTNTVLKNLARVFALDLVELKKKYGKLVGRKTSTPLALHPNLILLPVKIREVVIKDEGSRGYVVNSQIKAVEFLNRKKSRIIFLDGTFLDCLQSVDSINLVRAHGRIIARECQSSFTLVKEKEEVYQVVKAILSTLDANKVSY